MKALSNFTNFRVAVLASAVIGAGVALFAAAGVQQNYRWSADYPQVQLAEDAAAALARGEAPAAVVGPDKVDASASLAPFVTVYGSAKQPVASSGEFGGQILSPPAGVFDNAKARGQERFTWQTAHGQREAAVLIYQKSPKPEYVLAARNLREVEAHEDTLRLLFLATIAGISLVAAAAIAFKKE